MNDAAAAKWAHVRKMGKAKYVMVRGVLLWSIGLTALFTLIEYMTQQTMLSSWLTTRLIVFGILGFFISNQRWDSRERLFAARQERTHQGSKSSHPSK
ncbi:hypothetical protein [Paenibacillus sp. YYML68]|uniref:hypothetical protein n=1 Tax=Paenibacillus sp. YYML68 TaxID=2909250 RepID=UPI0024908FC9|nr:hypothetical protein [Paenibacillus sp. YYML68]